MCVCVIYLLTYALQLLCLRHYADNVFFSGFEELYDLLFNAILKMHLEKYVLLKYSQKIENLEYYILLLLS